MPKMIVHNSTEVGTETATRQAKIQENQQAFDQLLAASNWPEIDYNLQKILKLSINPNRWFSRRYWQKLFRSAFDAKQLDIIIKLFSDVLIFHEVGTDSIREAIASSFSLPDNDTNLINVYSAIHENHSNIADDLGEIILNCAIDKANWTLIRCILYINGQNKKRLDIYKKNYSHCFRVALMNAQHDIVNYLISDYYKFKKEKESPVAVERIHEALSIIVTTGNTPSEAIDLLLFDQDISSSEIQQCLVDVINANHHAMPKTMQYTIAVLLGKTARQSLSLAAKETLTTTLTTGKPSELASYLIHTSTIPTHRFGGLARVMKQASGRVKSSPLISDKIEQYHRCYQDLIHLHDRYAQTCWFHRTPAWRKSTATTPEVNISDAIMGAWQNPKSHTADIVDLLMDCYHNPNQGVARVNTVLKLRGTNQLLLGNWRKYFTTPASPPDFYQKHFEPFDSETGLIIPAGYSDSFVPLPPVASAPPVPTSCDALAFSS